MSAPAGGQPWSVRRDGLVLSVRLTPKSARDAIEGLERLADGRTVVKARVRAVPEAGAANTALLRLVAEWLALPYRAIRLESGATGRIKAVFLSGEVDELERRLVRLLKLAE